MAVATGEGTSAAGGPRPWQGSLRFAAAPPAGNAASARSHVARNNFDALRLGAALLVVYGHQFADRTGTFGLRLVLFFSISGFLIAGSWRSDPHAGRFLVRRFLRVWPAYALVIVACAAVSYAFPSPDMPEISRMASMFYLSNLWFAGVDWGFFPAHNPYMNQSLWMMRYEVDIYFAFVLVAMLRRRWLLPMAACAVVFAALRAPETHASPGGLFECWSLYFAGFFCFGLLLREFASLRRAAPTLLFLAVGVVLLALGERTAGLLAIVPPAAVWVGERSWPLLRSASRHGDLSLGIFLWAWPVHQLTVLWLPAATPPLLAFAVVLAQVVGLAWASWRFVEAPALRLKPRKPSAPVAGGGRMAGHRLSIARLCEPRSYAFSRKPRRGGVRDRAGCRISAARPGAAHGLLDVRKCEALWRSVSRRLAAPQRRRLRNLESGDRRPPVLTPAASSRPAFAAAWDARTRAACRSILRLTSAIA